MMRGLMSETETLATLKESAAALEKTLMAARRAIAEMEARLAWSNSQHPGPATETDFMTKELQPSVQDPKRG